MTERGAVPGTTRAAPRPVPADLPTPWALDDWQDLIRAHFVALDIRPGRDVEFRGLVDAHHIGPLGVAGVRSVAQDFRRTPTLIRGDDARFLQIAHLRRGTAALEQDGRRCRLGPGDLVLYDTSRPFTWSMPEPWEMDVFTWPRTLLGATPTTALTARPASGPGTTIVGAALRQARAAGDLPGREGERLAAALVDLVLSAAGPPDDTDDATVPPAGLPGVLAVIDAHLRDPALGPALVARRCHLSVRSLHRLFADQPRSLAATIRRRRLEAARTVLLRDPLRPVAVVAAEYCFSDASVFARAFREEYGQSPRDARAG